jgi:hypothetical protein
LYYGRVVGGGGAKTVRKGWDVCWDVLPSNDNIIKNITRKHLSVVGPLEEEVPNATATQIEKLQELEEKTKESSKRMNPVLPSQKEFAELDPMIQKDAKIFEMRYTNNSDDVITWEILEEDQHHIDEDFIPPDSHEVVSDNFDFGKDLADNFFDHCLPSIKGHAKIIDNYLADERATFYDTVKADKIQF